jgi:hypothetical protein
MTGIRSKVERSHRVDEQEFYQLLDKDGIGDDIHLFNDKLQEWEDYYNYHRPHGALDGQTPYERLLAKKPQPGCYRSPENLHEGSGVRFLPIWLLSVYYRAENLRSAGRSL